MTTRKIFIETLSKHNFVYDDWDQIADGKDCDWEQVCYDCGLVEGQPTGETITKIVDAFESGTFIKDRILINDKLEEKQLLDRIHTSFPSNKKWGFSLKEFNDLKDLKFEIKMDGLKENNYIEWGEYMENDAKKPRCCEEMRLRCWLGEN